jgi:hypothetical protein
MKDPFKKVTQAFNQHVKPATLENEFIPNNELESMRETMKSYKITYRVKLADWEERFLIVRAYTKLQARERFSLWKGLITDIKEI